MKLCTDGIGCFVVWPPLQALWLPEIRKQVHGEEVKDMYLEHDTDDTWTEDQWSSEEEGLQERKPPPPKQLPPIPYV
jgi:hypothetical protein